MFRHEFHREKKKDPKRIKRRFISTSSGLLLTLALLLTFAAPAILPAGTVQAAEAGGTEKTIKLRVCSWEEYIDNGGWDEDEKIELPSGTILGKQSMIKDFEDWYEKTYGVKVQVEYSTFGTNEDLYNMLTLGDSYDLICPSEYMFMKLMSEKKLVPFSDGFYDTGNPNNYYAKGVSPYILNVFRNHKIGGEAWSQYAAGFMWGVTGIVYNPKLMTREEASTWDVLTNPKFKNRLTIKDSVRECYFAAVGALEHDRLTSKSFLDSPDYSQNLEQVMNDTSPSMVNRVQNWLQDVKNNVYSFEVDSGKADMVTSKVAANYQWSGDAVYTMDQAEQDGLKLDFAVPKESTNIYFDGWCMLKSGIRGNKDRQKAAEAFINFLSRPDNAIRNMYYIGYTSCISGGSDPRILEYLNWKYGAKENTKNPGRYDLTYFFTGDTKNTEDKYDLTVDKSVIRRQLGAQYPSPEVIRRSSIMQYFNVDQSRRINRMWVNVRCYNLLKMPVWGWIILAIAAALIIAAATHKIITKSRARKHSAQHMDGRGNY